MVVIALMKIDGKLSNVSKQGFELEASTHSISSLIPRTVKDSELCR
jgi:hypothetical protein